MGPLTALMDSRGMLPPGTFCTGCGNQLNADGHHPAETYLGTYNGLCYPCTAHGPYVARLAVLDGCREVSWPPHSPSWRRHRERHLAYADCEACGGLGLEMPVHRSGGGKPCPACSGRYESHPLRAWHQDRRRRIMEAAQEAFSRQLDEAAGVPRRCPRQKRQALLQAFTESIGGEDAWSEWKRTHPVRVRAGRLLAAHARKAQRLGVGEWREPQEELDRATAAARRRYTDLQAKTFPVVTDDPCSRGCGGKAAWLCRGTLLCVGCWKEQEHKPGHRKAGERHPFGSCGECDAWTAAGWSWERASRYLDLALISQDMWEAYCHVWATAAHRYSSLGAGWRDAPSDPATRSLAAFMREALAEREAGREGRLARAAGSAAEQGEPGIG